MKTNTTVMALFGVAILSGGLTFALSGETSDLVNPVQPTKNTGFMNGHVTATLVDEDGNIKAYRQSDNNIVAGGLETIILQTFGNWTDTTSGVASIDFNHTSATNHGGTVKFMAIGTGGETSLSADQFDITTAIAGCSNKTAAWTYSDGGANTHPNTSSLLTIYTNVTFNGADGCNTASVDEAGLYTSMGGGIGGTGTKAGHMFARQTFTAVTIGSADSLKINWDISFQDT